MVGLEPACFEAVYPEESLLVNNAVPPYRRQDSLSEYLHACSHIQVGTSDGWMF